MRIGTAKLKMLPKIFSDTAEMLGTIFIILVLAVSLNKFMTYQQIPQTLVESISEFVSGKVSFLIMVNILLLIVGCVMDIMSAILILAPILTPMAEAFGINPSGHRKKGTGHEKGVIRRPQ